MDVHPPHHPINTWRDFLIHLATITLGLLIALGLEGAVEWAHHRSLVSEARENLHQELENNRKLADMNLTEVREDEARMRGNLEMERKLRDQPKDIHGNQLHFRFDWSSMSESAWQTARDTGALSFMAYKDVQNYADLYTQQRLVDAMAADLFKEQVRTASPLFTEVDAENLPPEEARRLLDLTATTSADLTTLEQMLSQLRDQYTEALAKQ
jgi:hypothetical protein